MPRPKKDPVIRQNEFLDAAKELFFSKGYDETSIRDILDAVGEKSVSPSVFYYYFSSKEDIYHGVMERYIEEYMAELDACLHDITMNNIEDRISGMMTVFIKTLTESKRAIDINNSMSNRLFVLDLRERITRRILSIWETAIGSLPWLKLSASAKKSLALYITGGICEMIYDFVFEQQAKQQDIKALAGEIINFTATVLDTPRLIRKRFVDKANNAF